MDDKTYSNHHNNLNFGSYVDIDLTNEEDSDEEDGNDIDNVQFHRSLYDLSKSHTVKKVRIVDGERDFKNIDSGAIKNSQIECIKDNFKSKIKISKIISHDSMSKSPNATKTSLEERLLSHKRKSVNILSVHDLAKSAVKLNTLRQEPRWVKEAKRSGNVGMNTEVAVKRGRNGTNHHSKPLTTTHPRENLYDDYDDDNDHNMTNEMILPGPDKKASESFHPNKVRNDCLIL